MRLFGTSQARRYYEELFAVIDLIATNPLMAWEGLELSPPMRIHPFKTHLVIYRIEEGGDILIPSLSVCDTGMRIGRERLFDRYPVGMILKLRPACL